MTKEAEGSAQRSNVIHFKSKRAAFKLPAEPTREELAFDWTLSEADKRRVWAHRGDDNRLRYAVQLCVLRKYGRFLDSYDKVPANALGYLCSQLEMTPLAELPDHWHQATESRYHGDICQYLEFGPFDEAAEKRLERWFLAAISETFYVENTIERAERFLKRQRIIIPVPGHLERIVNGAYGRAEQNMFATIAEQIPDPVKSAIDTLLENDPATGRTPLFRFGEYPPEAKAKKIADYFQNYESLFTAGLAKSLVSGIHPSLINTLSTAVKSYDAWRIKRFDDDKCYGLCACYLQETLQDIVDNLVDMNDRFLTDTERVSKKLYDEARRRLRKRVRRGMDTYEAFTISALAMEIGLPIEALFRDHDRAKLQAALTDSRALRRLEDYGYVKILHGKYPNFKRYFRPFLTLDFHAVQGAKYLIGAIDIARRYNAGEIKNLPLGAPIGFVPRSWKKMLYTDTGKIHPRTWEFSLAYAMRKALKSGDLFLPSGRHYVSFWNLVYDDQQWVAERQQVCTEQGFSLDPEHILAGLTETFDRTGATAVQGLPHNNFVKIKKGAVRFGKEEGLEEPKEVKKLRQLIETSLPKIRIEHLLMEVNALSGFSRQLYPVEGPSSRDAQSLAVLLASIVAHGTNLGVFAMADSTTKITVDTLRNVSKACLRQDTLKAANTALVNYQKSIEASSVWGSGEVSSSDGQRFGVSRSSLITSLYPRYFGFYDQAVSIYTHLSDQLSVFNTQVISCGQKEAPYVLNGLLENDSELSPRRHHTDTGGYSDHVFALCFLLGFSFMPRLKSLHKRRLFKIDRNHHYGALEPLFKGTVNLELVREQWEALIRVAASLKNRIVPADVIVKRLVSSSPADRLSKALTELGRLVKTVHILQYIQDEQLRRQIGKQLNRGEHRQGVARHVFFADQGEFRTGDLAQIMNKASCLSLLSNAILVWNTVHISKIVSRLRDDGQSVPEEHLARVSPLLHKHVIVNGMYDFAYRRRRPMQVQ